MNPEEYYKNEFQEVCKNIFLKKLTIAENKELKSMAEQALKSIFPSCFFPASQNVYACLNAEKDVNLLYERSRIIESKIPIIQHVFYVNGNQLHIQDTFTYYPEVKDGRRNPSDDTMILFECKYISDYSEELEDSFAELKKEAAKKIEEHKRLRKEVENADSIVDIPELYAEFNELLGELKWKYANYSEERSELESNLYYDKEEHSIFADEEEHPPIRSFHDLWEDAHDRFDKSDSDKYREWKKIW